MNETTSTFQHGYDSYMDGESTPAQFSCLWGDHPDVIAGWNAAATEVGCLQDVIPISQI